MIRTHMAAWLICLLIWPSPTPVHAQSSQKSVTHYQYNQCMKRPAKYGGNARNLYVAWASGLAHTCLYSEFPAQEARPFALRQCEESMRILRRRFNVSAPCKIVLDQGNVVDRTYANAISKLTRVHGKVSLFNGTQSKPRVMKGVYEEYPTKFKGANPIELNFKLTGDDIPLCKGTVRAASIGLVKFDAICFGQMFSGTSRSKKIIESGGLLFLAPEKIRIERDGSWIELSI